jgi:hypothetical protein
MGVTVIFIGININVIGIIYNTMQNVIIFVQPVNTFYARCRRGLLPWCIYALPKWQCVHWFVLKKVLLCIALLGQSGTKAVYFAPDLCL